LGYDERGWKYQTLTTWIVVSINYFWRPEFDVNWVRGPFFREQHFVPGIFVFGGLSGGCAGGGLLAYASDFAVMGKAVRSSYSRLNF
jgi:hypothetical protein